MMHPTGEISSCSAAKVKGVPYALSTMGINPVRFLILPRMIGITIIGPALSLLGMFIGMAAATRRNDHFYLTEITKRMTGAARRRSHVKPSRRASSPSRANTNPG